MKRSLSLLALLLAAASMAACDGERSGPEASVEDPVPDQPLPVEPGIVCRAQFPTSVSVTGEGFSPVVLDIPDAPVTALPTVTLVRNFTLIGDAGDAGEILYSDGWGETIESRNGELLTWSSQQGLTFTVQPSIVLDDAGSAGLIDVGIYDVRITNPNETEATSAGALAVVDKPVLDATTPGIVCLAEGARTVTLTGQTFLEIEGTPAEMTWDCDAEGTDCAEGGAGAFSVTESRDCQTIAHPAIDSQFCATADVEIAQDGIPVGFPAVEVLNPETAACRSEEPINLRVVPPPSIEAVLSAGEDASGVQPGDGTIICLDEEQDVTLFGQDILVIDGEEPAVSMTNQSGAEIDLVVVSTDGCSALETQGHTVERCDSITVTIPAEDVTDIYQPTLTLTNPAPAGCGATDSTLLTIAPGPELDSATPPLVCTEDGERGLTLTGGFFLVVDGEQPTVELNGAAFTLDDVTGCSDVSVAGRTVQSCTTLELTLGTDSLAAGDVTVAVTNPAPADCTVSDDVILTVPPRLALLSAEPPTVCQSSAGNLNVEVTGTGFLRVGGDTFTVTVEGTEVTPTVDDADCTALNVDGLSDVEACTAFTVALDASLYELGGVEISVANPGPADCAETSTTVFEITSPPTIASIEPSNICEGVAESLTITGTLFAQNAEVLIGTTPANTVTVNSEGTEIVATWDPAPAAGDYDVTVNNGAGCSSTATNGITIDPTPLVFFVDPPVIYNGISTDATVYSTGLGATAQSVELINSAGDRIALDFESPNRPNQIIATFPSEDPTNAGNPLPAGDYEISVVSDTGCVSSLNGTVTITDALDLALLMVDPAFASPTQPTAVTITAKADGDLTGSEVNFVSTPRVYLNPTTGDQVAVAVQAVVFEDSATLTAVINPDVIPGGLPSGQYDLIVVNPTGEVGILAAAVVVTDGEPPIVAAVSPATLDAGVTSTATVFGTGFDPATAVVDLACRDFASGAAVSSGAVTVDSGTSTATTLDVTVDAGTIPIGAVCVLTITNGDGASFSYSAVSFKNASAAAATLASWQTSSVTLNEARRGLSLAAGRPTFRSRVLYAIGGDDGTEANAKTSVESIGLDAFGDLGAGGWVFQRNDLETAYVDGATTSSPRSFTGIVQIDRFLYLVGGSNGSEAVNTVLRAQILDPLDGPEVVDLEAALGDGANGLTEGLWLYKVAAVFPDTDASNPGGESLPGEVFNVELPTVEGNLILTLTWDAVPGASGYRVYRTAAADEGIDDLQLVAEVATTSYRDEGDAPISADTPMPRGSTGVWHSVEALGTTNGRMAPAVVVAPDPADASRYFIYAVGGRNSTDGPLASGEYATVTIANDGSQTISAWTPITATLTEGVSELSGAVVTPRDVDVIVDGSGTDTLVYFGVGYNGTSTTTAFHVAEIGADGQIAAFTSPGNGPPNPGYAGANFFSAGGVHFILGGQGRSAGTSGRSKDIVNADGDFNATPAAWDSLGDGALPVAEPRIFSGHTQESAFFYIAGGASSGTNGGVVDSVLLTIQ